MRIAIIGSSTWSNGTMNTFMTMCTKALAYLIPILDENKHVTLVSGGAAWSDHVAVTIFLTLMEKYPKLSIHIYLPCSWVDSKHYDNGSSDWKTNPGWLANKRHSQFSSQIGSNSLAELNELYKLSIASNTAVAIEEMNGFYQRNDQIAICDMLLCITNNDQVKGGSLYTYNRCRSTKYIVKV